MEGVRQELGLFLTCVQELKGLMTIDSSFNIRFPNSKVIRAHCRKLAN